MQFFTIAFLPIVLSLIIPDISTKNPDFDRFSDPDNRFQGKKFIEIDNHIFDLEHRQTERRMDRPLSILWEHFVTKLYASYVTVRV